ncbi:MAG: T9SS type A sorting domain-containing protein, partial [Bacteroidota bacterium]|nr:T9SS type A sorting domain-containing protein [Bacteroidota bacterium]
AGFYTVRPSDLLLVSPPNYVIQYEDGGIFVQNATLTVSADSSQTTYGTPPSPTVTITGLVNGDSEASVVQSGPNYLYRDSIGGLVSGSDLHGGNYSIEPTGLVLNPPVNYTIQYSNGILTVNPADLFVTADSVSAIYGQTPVPTATFSGFQYADDVSNSIASGPSYTYLDGTNTSVSGSDLHVGSYTIQPSGVALIYAKDYNLVYVDGGLDVTPATLTITADDVTDTYGNTPSFSASYAGFQFLDDESSVLSGTPTFSLEDGSGNPVSAANLNAGSYSIIPSLQGFNSPSDYIAFYVNGTLTMQPATLTVTAQDTFIYEGDPAPTSYHADITGFIGSDASTVVSGPSFALSPVYNGNSGVYAIVPSNLILNPSGNYSIQYINGNLYVNPAGKNLRDIRPSLDCVDTLVNHPSGFAYVAHFSYENRNQDPYYIPIGPDNNLSSAGGSYSGIQPELFLPGTHQFDIYFDGVQLTWTVVTTNGNKKASRASDASSTSNKCNTGPGNSGNNARSGIAGGLPSEGLDGMEPAEVKEILASFQIYPNPTRGTLTVETGLEDPGSLSLWMTDLIGRRIGIRPTMTGSRIEMDLSDLPPGVYLMSVQFRQSIQLFKITKQ